MTDPAAVVWHDVECHGYSADLPLWRALADAEDGPVLDVGAGTGRVALDLAAAGHHVTALDRDAALLAALRRRAAGRGLRVETVAADAQAFVLGRAFGLILVPMQTIQLLDDRTAFLAAARAHLAPGGLLAVAIADELVPFEPGEGVLPDPDEAQAGGWHYASQPVAVRMLERATRIERVRIATAPDGTRTGEADVIELAALDARGLAHEAAAAGLRAEAPMTIDPTPEHVGSVVVMLRA